MLQKNMLIASVIALVILLGSFLLMGSREKDVANIGNNASTTEHGADATTSVSDTTGGVTPPAEKKMAFADFLRMTNETYQCTIDLNIGQTQSKGTTYISNGMVRTDYTLRMDGATMSNSMIVRDGYTYSWSSLDPKNGYKIKVDQQDIAAGAEAFARDQYTFDANMVGDYDCQPWGGDGSKFQVPVSIMFTEIDPLRASQ